VNEKQIYVSKQEHTSTLLQNDCKFIFTFSVPYDTSKENFSEMKNSRMPFNVYAYKPFIFNPLNAKLNPICNMLALLGAHPILHVSRIRVNCFYFFIPLMNIRVIKSKTVVF